MSGDDFMISAGLEAKRGSTQPLVIGALGFVARGGLYALMEDPT